MYKISYIFSRNGDHKRAPVCFTHWREVTVLLSEMNRTE